MPVPPKPKAKTVSFGKAGTKPKVSWADVKDAKEPSNGLIGLFDQLKGTGGAKYSI